MKVKDSYLASFIRDTFILKEGIIYIFDDFIITEINENVILDQEYILFIYQILEIYGKGKPHYGVISNRIHNYAINTTDFMEIIKMANRQYTTAIIVYDKSNERRAKFESRLYQCGFKTFTTLENAANWMHALAHQTAC